MTRAEAETLALSFPGAVKIVLWGETDVYKVRGKVFCAYGVGGEGLSFKVSQIGFSVLTDDGPGRQAPGFARGHWVQVGLDDFTSDEARDWIEASYELVTSKLTRAVRKELGLA